MATVYGALSSVLGVGKVRVDGRDVVGVRWLDSRRREPVPAVNADLLLKRLWIGESDGAPVHHLWCVAQACAELPPGLLDELDVRRCTAAERLAARSGATACGIRLTPQWRLVVGHGEDSAHETSLTMSPTYGFPIVPGSALKGVAASQARSVHGVQLPPEVVRLFGTPRPNSEADAVQGSVVVLDAYPVEKPQVVVDVLTPHVKPYYDKDSVGRPAKPPAEYHNPVPVHFLAVAAGTFRAWLIGPPADVQRFADLLHDGADDLGLGGKTAAGYGYCKIEVEL